MNHYICLTCGVQYSASDQPPEHCPVCEDDRQYIGWNGQRWTTLEDIQKSYHNVYKTPEPGLTEIGTEPVFAIGQRAILLQTPNGNILWDCISLLDEATITWVNSLGGIAAIAISHPHYYSSMIEWGEAFQAPVYLHSDDREWVMRPNPLIDFWDGEQKTLLDGVTLIRCGGHFPGGTVLHWRDGAGGNGILFSGDIINVVSDRRFVSFMYSYPNLIPLPAAAVRTIVAAVEPFSFQKIYGAWWDRVVSENGKEAVERSAQRYITAIDSHR